MDLGENIGILAIMTLFGLAIDCILIAATVERDPWIKKGLYWAGGVITVGNSIGMVLPGPIGAFATVWSFVLLIGLWFIGVVLLVVKHMR